MLKVRSRWLICNNCRCTYKVLNITKLFGLLPKKGNTLSPQGIKDCELICLRLSAKAKQSCWIFQTDFSKLASCCLSVWVIAEVDKSCMHGSAFYFHVSVRPLFSCSQTEVMPKSSVREAKRLLCSSICIQTSDPLGII